MLRRAIVAREVRGGGKVVVSGDLEGNVAETFPDALDRHRTPAHVGDVTAGVPVMATHIRRHPSESSRIVERSGQPFGFLEIPQDPRELVQGEERLAKVEPKIDRALDCLARLG